jgi:Raf kinase inhibitor-like YbhB/YbcL family protein
MFTCDGQDVSPALDIAEPPATTAALALVVDDPDAPRDDPFVHWLLWNIRADVQRIPVNVSQTATVEELGDARQGTNDAGSLGYTGPCPSTGDSPHRYRFTLYALDTRLAVDAGATRDDLAGPLAEHRLDATTLTGTYARQQSQYWIV